MQPPVLCCMPELRTSCGACCQRTMHTLRSSSARPCYRCARLHLRPSLLLGVPARESCPDRWHVTIDKNAQVGRAGLISYLNSHL